VSRFCRKRTKSTPSALHSSAVVSSCRSDRASRSRAHATSTSNFLSAYRTGCHKLMAGALRSQFPQHPFIRRDKSESGIICLRKRRPVGISRLYGWLASFPRRRLRKVSDLGGAPCARRPNAVHRLPRLLHHRYYKARIRFALGSVPCFSRQDHKSAGIESLFHIEHIREKRAVFRFSRILPPATNVSKIEHLW